MLTKPLKLTAWPPQTESGSFSAPPIKGSRQRGPLTVFLVAAFFLIPAAFAQAQAQPEATKPAGYVGSDTCQGCHDDVFKAFQRNPHRVVETAKKYKFETMACESCHGPGAKHAETTSAEDILNPAKMNPDKADRSCLKCHLNMPTQVGRINGGHARSQVSCTACHQVHQGRDNLRPRKASAINQDCAKCHTSVWAEFQRPHRHPLPEGGMSCVDCHNPHGGVAPGRNLRFVAANEPTCFRCHTNLRGPFTFEHAPVKLEGCQTCHMPHGSANPRMLVRHEVQQVCLECHANASVPVRGAPSNGGAQVDALGGLPPAFHNLRNPRFRNCTVCHVKVHGSYVDRTLER